MLVVDPWDWLDKNGDLPEDNPRLRRQVLRVARLIEYGGPLPPMFIRETLVECSKRPAGEPCPGLLWVVKTKEHTIEAACAVCGGSEVVIHNWRGTQWADGMMAPVPACPAPADRPGTGPSQAN
jgi:hypothetical protein